MTLVVARRTARGVRLVADWRLTYKDAVRGPSYMTGTVKPWILRNDLCVAYAGNAYLGAEAIRGLMPCTDSVRNVNRALVRAWDRAGGEVDFLVAGLTEPSLTLIRGAGQEDRVAAHIGDPAAFDAYQTAYGSLSAELEGADDTPKGLREDYAIGTRMFKALQAVVDDPTVECVGELVVAVFPDVLGLIYAPSFKLMPGATGQTFPSGVPTQVEFGGADVGGFGYSILGARERPAIGVYFVQGQLGALFHPARHEAPIVYRQVHQSEFVSYVRGDQGITLIAGVEVS